VKVAGRSGALLSLKWFRATRRLIRHYYIDLRDRHLNLNSACDSSLSHLLPSRRINCWSLPPAEPIMLQRTSRSLFTSLRPSTSQPLVGCRAVRLAAERSRRWYSIHADHAAVRARELDAAGLTIQKTKTPKELIPPQELVFGRNFTGTASISAPWGVSKL
jgi:hypothetical protein